MGIDWSMWYYRTEVFCKERDEVEAALRKRLQNGESASAEIYNEELRRWEARPESRSLYTPYFRAALCYDLIHNSELNGYPPVDYTVPAEILAAWGKDIARDGLEANVLLPDDKKMRKIFRRSSRTFSIQWEAQGHVHKTDGLSLLERIYAVHHQLENGGNEL